MGTSHQGWEAVIKLNKPVARKSIGTGDGSTKRFVVDSDKQPIADIDGDAEVTSADVDIWVAGSKRDPSTYFIDQVEGDYKIIELLGDPPASGETIEAKWSYEIQRGLARSVSFEVSRASEEVYVTGQKEPALIKEGKMSIKGDLEHLLVDKEFYSAIAPEKEKADTYVIQAKIAKAGEETKDKYVTLMGVKFDTWGLDLPYDDFLTESLDFKATSVKWTEK